MHEWYQETHERQRELCVTVLGSNSTVAMQDETFPACKVEFWALPCPPHLLPPNRWTQRWQFMQRLTQPCLNEMLKRFLFLYLSCTCVMSLSPPVSSCNFLSAGSEASGNSWRSSLVQFSSESPGPVKGDSTDFQYSWIKQERITFLLEDGINPPPERHLSRVGFSKVLQMSLRCCQTRVHT